MIKVRSVMNQDFATVTPATPLIKAATIMHERKLDTLIVAQGKKPVALLTENDIVAALYRDAKSVNTTKVSSVMHDDYDLVSPTSNFTEVEDISRTNPGKGFIVTESQHIVGLVTETDITNATRDFTHYHNLMQETILVVFGLTTAFFLLYFSPLGRMFFG